MDLTTFFQSCVTSVSIGSAYALIAIGYTMVYGILRLINFAHGDIFMMAGYFTIFAMSNFMLPWYVAIPLVLAMTALLGVVIERIAYKPLRSAPRMSIMISAIGVSFFLENFATYLFTGLPKSFPGIGFLQIPMEWGSVKLQSVSIITPIVTIVLVVALMTLVNKTKIGMAMRAAAKDFETAQLMGIKINRVISFTFAVGSVLAAVGAILYFSPRPMVYPYSGMMPGLKCFVAAVLGGIGSIPGACIGGFIIGAVETFLVAMFPTLSGYSDAFTFVLLILMLLVRPTGLLGEKMTDKV
ncbi:branched-chain amino acid ABC transporter permease [Pseudoflavonifractor sp. AF19-9AC]|uniref:branched-chain amino acid ABC transporter permease n=1 Tax=Pseudoflavonifractor sp. AF19-9AC TaxID=2292244 RepID=UPI000E49997E|nr:branched-chain amino acid ABC transporter permease [Pseudoflavonifractor sp. AF19-9AC]RHR11314.1 branched-chain amino acid ABC transporter permease [Pseudoflavonifractor sp. AF19-9AC]